jgi:hypothetical protein
MHVKDSLGRKPPSLLGFDVMGMDLVWRLFNPEKNSAEFQLGARKRSHARRNRQMQKPNVAVIKGALFETAIIQTLDLR